MKWAFNWIFSEPPPLKPPGPAFAAGAGAPGAAGAGAAGAGAAGAGCWVAAGPLQAASNSTLALEPASAMNPRRDIARLNGSMEGRLTSERTIGLLPVVLA